VIFHLLIFLSPLFANPIMLLTFYPNKLPPMIDEFQCALIRNWLAASRLPAVSGF